MRKFFKKTKLVLNLKRLKQFLIVVMFLMLLIILMLLIYVGLVTAIRETTKTLDYFVQEEQKRDLDRFEKKLEVVDGHLDELQEQLKVFNNKRYKYLTNQQKREILKISWELQKDSLRIEGALANHQNDLSTTFYPRKNEKIEDKFKEYWRTHILIDRLINDIDRMVYSQKITKFQLDKLEEDLQEIIKMIKKRLIK